MDKIKSYFSDTASSKLDILVVLLYVSVVFVVGTVYHEPWFDESTAWMLARTDSVYDILFNVPHYEGHIPLWHLVLKLVILLRLPYELSLLLVNLIFLIPAVIIFVFKSKLPRIIRYLVPFSYFLLYQYGMISRPYSIMICAFMFLAIFYPKKDTRPGPYILSLALLCSSTVYGIVLSCGIVLSWLVEIFSKKGFYFSTVKSFVKDKRFYYFLALFVYALCLLCLILPRVDSVTLLSVSTSSMKNNFFMSLFYMLFSSLSDCLVTSAFSGYTLLQNHEFTMSGLIFSTCVGGFCLFCIIRVALLKGTCLLFLIPYLLLCLFSSGVYFYTHHIGIVFLFVLFWSIVSYNKKTQKDLTKFQLDPKFLKYFKVSIGVIVVVQLYWSVSACMLDISYPYSCGRQVASFIKENNLDKYSILAQWQISDNLDPSIPLLNVNSLTSASNILPYFDKDLFINFDSNRRGFNPHKLADWKTNQQELARWKKSGTPDILLFEVDLPGLFNPKDIYFDDYTMIYCSLDQRIFKDKMVVSYGRIYMRNDLYKKTHIHVQSHCSKVY